MYPHGPGYGYLIGGGSGLPIISVIQIKMVLETVEPGSSGSKPSALVTRLVQSILWFVTFCWWKALFLVNSVLQSEEKCVSISDESTSSTDYLLVGHILRSVTKEEAITPEHPQVTYLTTRITPVTLYLPKLCMESKICSIWQCSLLLQGSDSNLRWRSPDDSLLVMSSSKSPSLASSADPWPYMLPWSDPMVQGSGPCSYPLATYSWLS